MNDEVQLCPGDSAAVGDVRESLRHAAAATREADLAPAGHLGLRDAERSLRAAETVVRKRIAKSADNELATVLMRLGAAHVAVREAEIAERSNAVTSVHKALHGLRTATSLATLVERVPTEINRLGYQRSLLSRVKGTKWLARSAFAQDDVPLADSMLRIGSGTPGVLSRGLPEAEAVSRRAAVLVDDASADPRIHPQLQALMDSHTYIAAPLTVRGQVIGLVHADQYPDTPSVDRFDRDLLGLFAEGLGCVFERTVLQEQLRSLKRRLEVEARSIDDLTDGFLDVEPPAAERSVGGLTRREREVFEHVASGETNSQIAAKLYVSPGTVKCHVKSVLRKLGAANRAEAVARYHELAR